MAPKRKGVAKAAAKSRKAKAEEKAQEEAAAPESPVVEEEAEKVEDKAEEDKEAEKVADAKAEDVNQEEKKVDDTAAAAGESKDEEKIEDKAVVKEEKVAKPKGRKKKEAAAPLVPGTKRVTRSNPGPRDEAAKEEEAKKASSKAHIIIEHCKQCTSFKTRAIRAQSYLLEAQPGLKISINPEKPRKGCFEIRDDTGRIFVSLQDLERPYTKLKELDLEEISEEILKQIE